jgi:hypothetical protein
VVFSLGTTNCQRRKVLKWSHFNFILVMGRDVVVEYIISGEVSLLLSYFTAITRCPFVSGEEDV